MSDLETPIVVRSNKTGANLWNTRRNRRAAELALLFPRETLADVRCVSVSLQLLEESSMNSRPLEN